MDSSDIKIVTWNVNGIRSRIFNNIICSKLKKHQNVSLEENSSLFNLINETNPDIICFQETRCDKYNGSLMKLNNYYSYFNESKLNDSRGPNRYSGTAIYTKIKPINIEYNLPNYDDKEGRIIIAHYLDFILINIYSPNSGTNYENKILFQNKLFEYLNTIDNKIIFCGDFNIAMDTHFDKFSSPEVPGTYSHELEFYKKLLNNGFIDSISVNDKIVYTWWDQRSKKVVNPKTNKETNLLRLKNKGWRIDYILTKHFTNSESHVLKHIGEEYIPHASDHAPLFGIIN